MILINKLNKYKKWITIINKKMIFLNKNLISQLMLNYKVLWKVKLIINLHFTLF